METQSKRVAGRAQTLTVWSQKRMLGLSRHWLLYASLFWGITIGLPWTAPILMQMGATGMAGGVYYAYSYLCHQLADRSFFLFGPKMMYSYTELLPYATDTNTFQGLRAFVGTPELGYKVAWSDRMVSLYGGMFLAGLLFVLLRGWFRSPRWKLLLVTIVPIVVDGTTHMLSDLSGIGHGFRYSNAWLAVLTRNALPVSFYVGNALGSFNSWMRLSSGLLAGLGLTWVLYPLLGNAFQDMHKTLAERR